MTELTEPLKERRIAYDKDMLGKLSERRGQLIKELEFVDGQIRSVNADLFLLGVHNVSTEPEPPKRPLDILKGRLNALNRLK